MAPVPATEICDVIQLLNECFAYCALAGMDDRVVKQSCAKMSALLNMAISKLQSMCKASAVKLRHTAVVVHDSPSCKLYEILYSASCGAAAVSHPFASAALNGFPLSIFAIVIISRYIQKGRVNRQVRL